MGERSNVQFQDHTGNCVNVYSHWGGTALAKSARKALNSSTARERWDDPSYLTRIVVQRMLNELGSEDKSTGLGLGTTPDDNDSYYAITTFDLETKMVFAGEWVGTYDDFAALSDKEVEDIVLLRDDEEELAEVSEAIDTYKATDVVIVLDEVPDDCPAGGPHAFIPDADIAEADDHLLRPGDGIHCSECGFQMTFQGREP